MCLCVCVFSFTCRRFDWTRRESAVVHHFPGSFLFVFFSDAFNVLFLYYFYSFIYFFLFWFANENVLKTNTTIKNTHQQNILLLFVWLLGKYIEPTNDERKKNYKLINKLHSWLVSLLQCICRWKECLEHRICLYALWHNGAKRFAYQPHSVCE